MACPARQVQAPSRNRQYRPFRPGSAAALKRTYSSAASAPSGSAGSAPFARADDGDGGAAFPLAVAARGPPRPSLMAVCTCALHCCVRFRSDSGQIHAPGSSSVSQKQKGTVGERQRQRHRGEADGDAQKSCQTFALRLETCTDPAASWLRVPNLCPAWQPSGGHKVNGGKRDCPAEERACRVQKVRVGCYSAPVRQPA